MRPTYTLIIRNHFQHFHAEILMAACSTPKQGWKARSDADYYRVWLIKEGRGVLHMDGKSLDVQPGMMFLLPVGASLSLETEENERVTLYWCHFRASIGDMKLFELIQLPSCVKPKCSTHISRLFETMIKAFHSELFTRELRLQSVMLEIMAHYLEYSGLNEDRLKAIEPLEKLNGVLKYIEDHLTDNIGVDELAKLAFLHPNYFIAYFKNAIGCSPIQYVNSRRLERARRLLESTTMPVSEIAEQVGLQNHYLSRMFKQHTGLSPSRYRQIYLAAYDDGVAGEEE